MKVPGQDVAGLIEEQRKGAGPGALCAAAEMDGPLKTDLLPMVVPGLCAERPLQSPYWPPSHSPLLCSMIAVLGDAGPPGSGSGRRAPPPWTPTPSVILNHRAAGESLQLLGSPALSLRIEGTQGPPLFGMDYGALGPGKLGVPRSSRRGSGWSALNKVAPELKKQSCPHGLIVTTVCSLRSSCPLPSPSPHFPVPPLPPPPSLRSLSSNCFLGIPGQEVTVDPLPSFKQSPNIKVQGLEGTKE